MDVTYYPHHTKNISQIKASDSDSQENAFLKYEIIRGNSKQIFSINQYTGLLCSTHVLSQQDAGSYELEFLVKDSGSPVLSARTTVYLTLTVSNKTSEMLNAVNIKKDNKIHLTSAIIIVSVAVTIAVIITASISVCILRCCNPRSVPVAEGGYVSSGQRHLISPPYPANPWSNVALPTSDAVDMRRSSQPPTPRMQTHPYARAQNLSTQGPDSQPAPDSVSQMYIQDIALPSISNKTNKRANREPNYSSRSSIKSSLRKNREDWTKVNSRHHESDPDAYPSQYCNPPPSHSDQQTRAETRPLGQVASYPSDTTIVARGFYTPYMNENGSQIDAKSYSDHDNNSLSGRNLQSRNVPASGSETSINRPLPPLPH